MISACSFCFNPSRRLSLAAHAAVVPATAGMKRTVCTDPLRELPRKTKLFMNKERCPHPSSHRRLPLEYGTPWRGCQNRNPKKTPRVGEPTATFCFLLPQTHELGQLFAKVHLTGSEGSSEGLPEGPLSRPQERRPRLEGLAICYLMPNRFALVAVRLESAARLGYEAS